MARRRGRPTELIWIVIRAARWWVVIYTRPRRGGPTAISSFAVVVIATYDWRRAFAIMTSRAVTPWRPASVVLINGRISATDRGPRAIGFTELAIIG